MVTKRASMLMDIFVHTVQLAGQLFGWSEAQRKECIDHHFREVSKIQGLDNEGRLMVCEYALLTNISNGNMSRYFEDEKQNETLRWTV